MQEKITETTAATALGQAPGKNLLKVASGQYAGRMIALVQTSPGQIAFTYADGPYRSWSELVTIATDAADEPFDGVMSPEGHVYVVFTQDTTGYLILRRLHFSGGAWSVLSPVTIYDGDSHVPSIVVEPSGDLRVAWAVISGSLYTIRTKESTDSGATWGGGPSDPGDALTSGASDACVRLVCDGLNVHAIYSTGGVQLAHRSLALDGGSWGDETVLATGTDLEGAFDAAAASDNRVGVVWNDGVLKYREFDGANWGPMVTLNADGGAYPQIRFAGTVPVVVYLSPLAAEQNRLMYTTRQTGEFAAPALLDRRSGTFDSVALYDASTATFADVTSAAADAVTADLFHPATSVMLQNSGDALYAGMEQPFRYMKILLSTAGSGGTVAFSYWDGSVWQAFVPESGAFAFDAVDAGVILWEDANDIPADWQKRLVNGANRFWVKIEVVSTFSTAPVGSRITAASDLRAVIVRR